MASTALESRSDETAPKASQGRAIAVLGNAGDPAAWSGIPYHFFKAAHEIGFASSALNLHLERVKWRRFAWNAGRVLSGDRPGGFQYSPSCLEKLYRAAGTQIEGNELVSHFQLFPPPRLAKDADVRYGHYIDMPLKPLFDEYGEGSRIGRRIRQEALESERQAYSGAHRVVCMSRWAADAVRHGCGIEGAKVKVVLPGANLDESVVERLTAGIDGSPVEADLAKRPFRLGFTGKHPERKGLRRLVGAAELLAKRGHGVEVRVIGEVPADLRKHRLLRSFGFIDKRGEMERFVREVSGFDLGCLPSYAEGLGISTLESLRLGVPVLGTAVGGIPDAIPAGAGILVERDVTPDGLADAIEPLIVDASRYTRMRQEARRLRHHYAWKRAAQEFEKSWT